MVLGLPLVGGNLAQLAIGITDTVMLGWYGVEALAAVVLASTAFFTLFIASSGFAAAVLPMVAEADAADDVVKARRVTRMGLWISMVMAALCMPVFWYSEAVFLLLGQPETQAALGQSYLRIAGFGIFPALLVMVLKSFLSALERTQIVLWGTVLTAVLNGFLNWALIFGNWGFAEMGLRGAAVASLFSNFMTVVVLLAYVYGVPVLRSYDLFGRLWRIDAEALRDVFRLGWPIGLTSLAEVGLFSASAVMIGWIGTHELAAHGIALQISAATFMVHLGLSSAATVRAGRAFGRHDPDDLKRGGWIATVFSMSLATITVVLFLTYPEQLVGLFLAPDDPERPQIVAIGITLLVAAALFQVVDSAQVMALGLLRGVQDTKLPMVLAAVSYWGIGLPAGYILGFVFDFGVLGVWYGLVVGLAVAAVLLAARFWVWTVKRI